MQIQARIVKKLLQTIRKILFTYYIIFVTYIKQLKSRYRSQENLINKNWIITKKCGNNKQAILINSIVYFYLIIYFVLFTDLKQFIIQNWLANKPF